MGLKRDESGQAVLEYILILFVVVSAFFTVATWFNRFGFAKKLTKPVSTDFAKAYQFGDTKAAGFDSDTPKRHPRIDGCEECFRLFINPGDSQ